MSSARGAYGYGLPARPSERLRPRISEDSSSSRSSPGKDSEGSRSAIPRAGHSRLPSRVTQTPSTKRPVLVQSSSLPLPDRHSRSWGSSSTAVSENSRSHAQTGSGSSSSATSYDSSAKALNVLRRKKPSISREASQNATTDSTASISSSSSNPSSQAVPEAKHVAYYDRTHKERTLKSQEVQSEPPERQLENPPTIYPELDRYRHVKKYSNSSDEQSFQVPFRLATQDLPPPTPASILFSGSSSQLSASPSTKWSGSPGPGPYSRDTTPTSISSQSPSMVTSGRLITKGRQHSPALSRPPVTRRRAGSIPGDTGASSVDPQGLAAVRESLNSSSSSSTVRDGDRGTKKRDRKATHLSPPPPSPPPRKSSQKFRKTESDDESLPPKSRGSDRPNQGPPSPKSAPVARPGQFASPSKEDPPRRPSRDGMPDMQPHLFGRIPIVHSNIPASYLSPERRGSEPTIPTSNTRAPNASSLRVKNASTSNLPAVQTAFARERPTTGLRDDDSKKTEASTISPPATTPSPKVSSSLGARFAFFGRKKKASASDTEDKTAVTKSARKGPAAGTGHEGYGRLGATRRRSGGASTLVRGAHVPRNSEESLNSTDSFFADRMDPVVISGGGIVENKNPRTEPPRVESSPSLTQGRPSLDSRAGSEISPTTREEADNMSWSTIVPQTSGGKSRSRRPSDSSDSDGITMKSTLAFRRSRQRLRNSPENPLRLPHPINTSGFANSPMTSFDTSVMSMSDDSAFETKNDDAKRKDLAHPAPKKLSKKERSPRRWNFFGRSQSRAPSKKEDATAAAHEPTAEKRPVPFYAMMDPSEHDGDVADIREILRNADVYTSSPDSSTTPETQHPSFEIPLEAAQGAIHATSVRPALATLPPAKGPSQAGRAITKPTPQSANILSSGRPSRLPQVGRIPAVVSQRPQRAQHVSSKSFSRPFRHSIQAAPTPLRKPDLDSVAKGPSPPRPSTPTHAMEGGTQRNGSDGNSTVFSSGSEATSAAAAASFQPTQPQHEFLRFSPRKNSESTQDTGSSASTQYPFAEATAVIPRPEDPPAEDEIWDEYNDLLEDNVGPRVSATSSRGIPFHLERYQTKNTALESPTLVPDSRKISMLSKATVSSAYSADMTERIRKAFQPHASPTTPYSLSEFVSSYGGQDVTTPVGPPPPLAMSRRSSTSSCKTKSSDSGSSSFDEAQPLAQVNIRVGSMTVSKWLTFGHVLFSDVRHELTPGDSKAPQHSVLVIDGLGNDDWSFYAAETYSGATFFNLSPRAPLPAELQNAVGFPTSPPNHHQIQYLSQLEKFPFASHSFTSIVLRFPVAAPESHYRNILTEAKRVLRPDGYFELSILDADLNNMGTIGRRAIRGLKERTHEEIEDINLSSTADLLVRLLGHYGFTGVKTARVGIPVASSLGHLPSNESDKAKAAEERKRRRKDPPSLAEMMSENSPTADEGITKMVSRVGRWWYTRCYESTAGVATQKSIWADKALLRECEELGTSLKLTVCYARAPDRH